MRPAASRIFLSFRPICLPHSTTKSGRIFSLIHEYIHFLYQQEDIFINPDKDDQGSSEKLINNITAEFLIPDDHLKKYWSDDSDTLKKINRISQLFNVSRHALAIKLKNMSLIGDEDLKLIIGITQNNLNKKILSSGGDFYITYFAKKQSAFCKSCYK